MSHGTLLTMLRFSVKTYHAMNCLTELASAQHQNRWLSISCLAAKNGVSTALLEQIFLRLRKAGYLTSIRGPKGGYRLAHPAEEIKLSDLIEVIEGKVYFQRCKGQRNCTNQQVCRSHHFLEALDKAWQGKLQKLTLYELLDHAHFAIAKQQAATRCTR